ETIDHPTFGHLQRDETGSWAAQRTIHPFGNVSLTVECRDGGPPSEKQAAVFADYESRLPQLSEAIELAILHYLAVTLRPIYAEIFEEAELEDVLPANADRNWLIAQLSLPQLIMPAMPGGNDRTP